MAKATRSPPPDLEGFGITLLRELGEGSFSRVFSGVHKGRRYAIKVQRRSLEPEVQRQFRREASLLACFDDPGLAKIHMIGESEGRVFLVMDIIEGPTLADVLRAGPLDEARIIGLARSLARALHVAHRRGVVHCDVKPRNIILPARGGAALVDFGLATHTSELQAGRAVVGTYLYAAPEQTGMLPRPVDGRADLYSLGVSLFECATGRPPFLSNDVGELMKMHTRDAPPRVQAFAPDVTWALSAIIARLLAKDPDQRYESAVALIEDLERIPELNERAGRGEAPSLGGVNLSYETSSALPLVGRRAELRALSQAVERASVGLSDTVLLRGRAGVGKTRVLREFCDRARSSGALVMVGACEQRERSPFSPLRRAVERTLRELDRMRGEERDATRGALERATAERTGLLTRFCPRLSAFAREREVRESSSDDVFLAAIAEFFQLVGDGARPLVLVLDDAQWIDWSSVQVLRRLALAAGDARLCVVLGAREDPRAALVETPISQLATRTIRLAPFEVDDISRLIQRLLGGALAPSVIEHIAARTGGIPVEICEYVHAMLDAGALRPHWGEWVFDRERLETLDLPGDVLEILTQRLVALEDEARYVLTAAAVIGGRFEEDLLPELSERPADEISRALARGVEARVIERVGQRRYAFVDERLHEALLARLDRDEAARMHARCARALEAGGADADLDVIFAIARHYNAAGASVQSDARVFESNLRAGQLAFDRHAARDAHRYLERAEAAARVAAVGLDCAFFELRGEVCGLVGRIEDADRAFAEALARAKTSLRRASIHASVAEVKVAGFFLEEAMAEVNRGFAALGETPPSDSARGLISAVAGLIAPARPRVRDIPSAAERRRIMLRLLYVVDHAAYFSMRGGLLVQSAVRTLQLAERPTPDRAQVLAYTNYAMVMSVLKLRRRFLRYVDRSIAMARSLGDRSALARAIGYRGYGLELLGDSRPALAAYLEAMAIGEHRLETDAYGNIVYALMWNLYDRGYVEEARGWAERVCRRFLINADARRAQTHVVTIYAACVFAGRGLGGAALQQLKRARAAMRPYASEIYVRVSLLSCELMIFVETGELDALFDRRVQQFLDLDLNPRRLTVDGRHGFIAAAQGVLLRALRRRAARPLRGAERARARALLDRVRDASDVPIIEAQWAVMEATYCLLTGQVARVEPWVERAETLALRIDSPRALCEAARVRAHLHTTTGRLEAAARARARAHALAARHGMATRAAWIQQEFQAAAPPPRPARVTGTEALSSDRESPEHPLGLPLHASPARFHETVLELSLSAARSSTLEHQAQLILDVLLGFLGAERGFLYLVDETGSTPRRVAGRGASGGPLPPEARVDESVVSLVFAEQRSLFLSAADERSFGSVGGARSESVLGLRSVIAAPVNLGERAIGVVYLDNRLAAGMFTRDDERVLQSLSIYIALAIESARLIRRELTAAAARREATELFESATRALGIAVITVDTDGELTGFDETLDGLTSTWRSAAEWWGAVRERLDATLHRALDGKIRTATLHVEPRSGPRRAFELTFTGRRARREGPRERQYVLVSDVTGHLAHTRRLRARAASLEDARRQAIAACRAKSVFLATVGRELRAPLSAIANAESDEQLARSSATLSQLVERLLEFTARD